MMLGSLQRIESTMKLLLGLEYERAVGFQQQERDENLTEGDTDDKGGEEGPGRFRRGLSAAGSMLGGAYSKAKGFASGSLAKLLGLGVLIFAFNKYREEIITAMAGILEYFNDVFEVFKSEGLGAAFNKVVDDFKTKFFPKIVEVSMNILSFLFGAVKSAAMEFLFGASGDKLIKQENLNRDKGIKNLQSMTGALTAAGVDLSASKVGDQSMVGRDQSGKFFLTENEQTKNLSKEDVKNTDMAINRALSAMANISDETEGRVQWKGLPRLLDSINYSLGDLAGVSVNDILNAVPLIDGFESTNEQLKEFRLYKSAGVTKETPEADRDLIFKNLAEMTSIRSALLEGNTSGRFNRVEYGSVAEMTARIQELKKDNVFLGAYTQAEISEMTGASSGNYVFDNYTTGTKSLNGMTPTGTNRTSSPSANFNPVTVNNVDNKKIIDAKEINYHDLQSQNINFTVRQLAKYANGDAVFGL
tara:strand:- start:44 stop:1465 length:1422 start_codon:yes stop_codon:yes gene_type:complete